ncbi:choline ABC transporter substrate-binding protein [Aquisalimonas sp. APHAB1-3]|uniref:choline ABC transporter substrate-binding protein n=1 Tax=Aquisalimonas sp. APHAB1-3 TaxID=3402080 RepID=UPI003AAC9759
MRNGIIGIATATALGMAATSAHAGDAAECSEVSFANVEWTGESMTTHMAAMVLETLGYETEVTSASVPISFEAVASGERDAFMGLWLPTQESMVRPHLDSGDMEKLVANLEGAKYTLAVPDYVYEAGVQSFEDLAEHADAFDSRIYGIEAGNDGNEIILDMIDDNAFDLGDWQLMESSEAGMLTQVERATRNEDWVVFLGWAPHPMNHNLDMEYLEGGDDYFGPNLGEATVYTVINSGYQDRCPNAAQLLEQFTLTVDERNEGESYIMDDGMDYRDAATKLIENNPELLERWLDGVTTKDGEDDALETARDAFGV